MWQIPPLHGDVLLSLVTLTAMEIVLGIDNVIFLAILVGKVPPEKQGFTRRVGLGLALVARLGLLFTLGWIMTLTKSLFKIGPFDGTGKNFILLCGGLFLMGKAVFEIHEKLESTPGDRTVGASAAKSLFMVLIQIMILDIVFSLDSVITAVGMVPKSEAGAPYLLVIVVAMILTVGVMLFFAGPVGHFVNRHPTMKMLALSFLLLIGILLVAEALSQHVPKGYIYFAMAFSLGVEVLNMKLRKQQEVVKLHEPGIPVEKPGA